MENGKLTTDCQKCGACCQHYKTVEVGVRDVNYKWLKQNGYLQSEIHYYRESYKVYGQRTRRKIMQMKMNAVNKKRCIALKGIVGESVICSIYEHRPDACRAYEAGESRCRTAQYVQIIKRF